MDSIQDRIKAFVALGDFLSQFNRESVTKKEGIVNYQVTNITDNVATIKTKISDEKGKEITTSDYKITCDGNSISIDFKSMMNQNMFKQYKDMDMDITGTNIELPNNLQVGQSLKDANLNMAINMGGMKMNMSINMINRKVNALFSFALQIMRAKMLVKAVVSPLAEQVYV